MAGGQFCPCRHSWSDVGAVFYLHVSGDGEKKGGVWKTVFTQLGSWWQQGSNVGNVASEGRQRAWGRCLTLSL